MYQPGSFTPLLRIETDNSELAKTARRSLADKLQQEGNIAFPAELISRLDLLERELQHNAVSEENRQWLAGCGLTLEQMVRQMEPMYVPERKIHLYHCDHRGLPLALINENGTAVWRAEYDEWGNQLNEDDPENLQQLIRLPGQQYDEETGLHYNRYRYYDPRQGRYITQDLIGLKGGWNLYQYTINPVQQVDPLGLDIWIEDQGPGEPALHQSVNIGAPDGRYNSYSYAMGSFLHGEVYNDVKHGGKIEMYKKTTKEQDEIFDKEMKAQLGEHGYYGYDDICRSWSQRQFESAPRNQENPPERKNVVVTIGGFDLSSKGSSTTGSGTSR